MDVRKEKVEISLVAFFSKFSSIREITSISVIRKEIKLTLVARTQRYVSHGRLVNLDMHLNPNRLISTRFPWVYASPSKYLESSLD